MDLWLHQNAFDYRRLIFRKKYGMVGTFTIPSGFVSVFSVIFICGLIVYRFGVAIAKKVEEIKTIGFHLHGGLPHFDWFFINTKAIMFVTLLLYAMVITALILGRRMAEGRYRISVDVFYFVLVYSLIAPFWLLRAVWNALWSKESSWTAERRVTIN